jgi:hypothetical protein
LGQVCGMVMVAAFRRRLVNMKLMEFALDLPYVANEENIAYIISGY